MIIVDAGPLIAFVDSGDKHHEDCVRELKKVGESLGTVWPPLTEALCLLGDIPKAQDALWEMIARGVVQLLPLGLDDVPRIRQLMSKYADRRMDFADAAILRVAEREGVRTIFTVDRRDFAVYRLHDKIRPIVIP